MLPPLAVFLLVVSTDAVMVEQHTFEYEDPDAGGTLLCALCPPGMYVKSPCTRILDTVCMPCPEEHFTEFWNFLPKCLYCSTICEGNRVVKKQCSATHNRACACKEGYYSEDGFCVPHTQCPPGTGAKIIGNTQRDTQCTTCPSGTFSAETSSSAQCMNYTDCGTLHVLLRGRRWHDSVCSSCANLTNGVNVLQDVLPAFFSHRDCRLSKLKKFAHLLRDGKNRRLLRPLKTRARLLRYINEWITNAETHQLKMLPKILQRSGLQGPAEKVQDMLTRIEEKVSECLSK